MRDIHLRYVEERYDADGILTKFTPNCPPDFNFGYDVVDDIAEAEPDRVAMVWCNPEGEEHTFTFAEMKYWSDKTANYLSDLGIGRGDMVMVILRRHYQFWFVATALHKLGAILAPATFMLKEHDLEYRVNRASVKAIICTSIGDIAQVVDNAEENCPSLELKLLLDGAGGGTSTDAASVAALSPFHFHRSFKAAFGMSPMRFLQSRRLEVARDLLTRGARVADVAADVGFESHGSFSVLFRKRFGISPRETRKKQD